MGFFDSVKDRIQGIADQFRPDEPGERYFDEYENVYDEDGQFVEEAGYTAQFPAQDRGESGLQQGAQGYQTPYGSRPPQESVSVFTRSGHLVDDSAPSPSEGAFSTAESFQDEMAPGMHPAASVRATEKGMHPGQTGRIDYAQRVQGYTPSATAANPNFAPAPDGSYPPSTVSSNTREGFSSHNASSASPYANSYAAGSVSGPGLTAIPRPSSGKLPAYSIKPTSYDDAQLVARRVQTNQPVVLSFKNTPLDTAKRMLDFCFGFTYGIGGKVQEIASRTFVVLPAGMELTQEDIEKLKRENNINS